MHLSMSSFRIGPQCWWLSDFTKSVCIQDTGASSMPKALWVVEATHLSFPAKKINGGIWIRESQKDTKSFVAWIWFCTSNTQLQGKNIFFEALQLSGCRCPFRRQWGEKSILNELTLEQQGWNHSLQAAIHVPAKSVVFILNPDHCLCMVGCCYGMLSIHLEVGNSVHKFCRTSLWAELSHLLCHTSASSTLWPDNVLTCLQLLVARHHKQKGESKETLTPKDVSILPCLPPKGIQG